MVRMPAFGLDGPWRDRPGFAQTMEQITGLAWLTGHADDQPRIQRGPCDPNGGLHAAFAALVGLERRDRTGAGCLVEAPMFEAALNVAAEPVLEWTAYGNRVARDGNRSPRCGAAGPVRLRRHRAVAGRLRRDRRAVAAPRRRHRPPRAGRPTRSCATVAGRRRHHDRLDAAIAAWAAPLDLAEAVDAARRGRRPRRARRPIRGAPADTRSSSPAASTRPVDHPVVGTHPVAGAAVPRRPASTAGSARPAPTLGQHNTEVLGGRLGCSRRRARDRSDAAGVIGHPGRPGSDRTHEEGTT